MRWPTARACAPCGCPKRATGAERLSAAATHEDRPSPSPTSSVPRRRPPRLGSPTSAGASRTAASVRRVRSPAHGFVGRRRAEALHDCFASTARVRPGTRRRSSASRVTAHAVMGLSASLCRSSRNPCVTCGALARVRRAVTFGCDFGAGLDCVDGSCAAKSVPLGGVCNPQVRGQCSSDGGRDASGGTRAGIVRCSFGTSPGNPPTARCLFTCDVAPSPGGPLCTGEWDVCGTRPRDQVRLIDGRCVLGEVRGDACTNPRSFSCGGPSTPWTCRPTDGDGGGSGTVPSPATPGICAVTGAVGDACDAASDAQCGDELSCGPDGVCVDGGVLPGGACTRDADCSCVAGVPATCAAGRGADTPTCRQWRGPFEACTGADARCWGGLACSEDADASVCINADGGGRLGSFCRTVEEDCVGLENAFCEASGWRGAVCKVRVGEGEVCDSLFNMWRVCADGLACMANGRPQGRCV